MLKCFVLHRSSLVYAILLISLGCNIESENSKHSPLTRVTFDTVGYIKKIQALETAKVDSMIIRQLDADSNHIEFLKLVESELAKRHLILKQAFPGRVVYHNHFLKVFAGGTYEAKNNEGLVFYQIYSFEGVYDIYGNLVSIKSDGLPERAY